PGRPAPGRGPRRRLLAGRQDPDTRRDAGVAHEVPTPEPGRDEPIEVARHLSPFEAPYGPPYDARAGCRRLAPGGDTWCGEVTDGRGWPWCWLPAAPPEEVPAHLRPFLTRPADPPPPMCRSSQRIPCRDT